MTSLRSKGVFVIAEAGVNHNGSMDLARKLVDVAAESGADAVKFQTFRADKLVSRTAAKAEYQIQQTGSTETHYEMIRRLELSEQSHFELVDYCSRKKIQFLSTPFDVDSIELLSGKLNLPILKLPSGEMTNSLLLLTAARTGKEIILSSGMATLEEVRKSLGVLAFGYLGSNERPCARAFEAAFENPEGMRELREKVTLLHCTTEYPAPFEDINLAAIATLKNEFGVSVGFSDHSEGIAMPIAAVSLGASVIEKHFTLDRALPGPDHKASLEPRELFEMVRSIRQVEQAIGSGVKAPAPSEKKNIGIARGVLVASVRVQKGEAFSVSNLTVKRAGVGVSPSEYWDYIGTEAKRDFAQDEVIS